MKHNKEFFPKSSLWIFYIFFLLLFQTKTNHFHQHFQLLTHFVSSTISLCNPDLLTAFLCRLSYVGSFALYCRQFISLLCRRSYVGTLKSRSYVDFLLSCALFCRLTIIINAQRAISAQPITLDPICWLRFKRSINSLFLFMDKVEQGSSSHTSMW